MKCAPHVCLSGGVKTDVQTCYMHTDRHTQILRRAKRGSVWGQRGQFWKLGHITILGQFTMGALQKKVTQVVWRWNNASFVLHVEDKQVKTKNSTQLENRKIQKSKGTATGVLRMRHNCRCSCFVFIVLKDYNYSKEQSLSDLSGCRERLNTHWLQRVLSRLLLWRGGAV